MKHKIPVALYIRISTTDQSTYSIASQQRAITEYAERNHLLISKLYTDNGESSYSFERKQFALLEKDLKREGIKYIIVYHLDRFSRNMAEAMIKIRELLDKGIRVRDVSEPLEMNDFDTNTFLLRSMKFLGAEMELRRLRERTQQGIRTANLKGIVVNKAPYGYINVKSRKDGNRLIIDEVKAQAVRFIYKEYIAGNGIAEIRRKAALKYGYTQKGNSCVERILANPIYAGIMKVNDPATGMPVVATHEPIVTESTFYMAQAITNQAKKAPTMPTDKMFLKGSLYCHCGKCMTVSNPKGKLGKEYWYYLCPVHKKNFNADKVHDLFLQILQIVQIKEKDLQLIKATAKKEAEAYISGMTARRKTLEDELNALTVKITRMERKFLETNISKEVFDETVGEYRIRKINIENELDHADNMYLGYMDKLDVILKQLVSFRDWFEIASVEQRIKAVKVLFGGVLQYSSGIYRTPYLDPIIRDKAPLLKEKGLLVVEQSLVLFPLVGGTGTISKTVHVLHELFVA